MMFLIDIYFNKEISFVFGIIRNLMSIYNDTNQ